MFRRWSSDERTLLRQLFLEARLPIEQIAERLGRTTAAVNSALTLFGIPRERTIPKFRMPTTLTPALARIHAHVCGDGHLFAYPERDHYGYLRAYRSGYYRRRYGFAYTNMNRVLLDAFAEDVRVVFGLTPRDQPKCHRILVRSKPAWELLKTLGAGRSRTWWIHPTILEAEDTIAAAWIRAFFDDEAHFVPQGGIRVRSVNRPGLEQVATMLRRFVPCHLTPARGLYPDETCYLVIGAVFREQFLALVGSTKIYDKPKNS